MFLNISEIHILISLRQDKMQLMTPSVGVYNGLTAFESECGRHYEAQEIHKPDMCA